MHWFDQTVGFFSPGAGLRRARARAAMNILQRGYEGAKVGRRTDGWRTPGSGSNAEIATALPRLRDRSRDLVRNNPYAAKGVNALVGNLVGSGLKARARSGDAALNDAADKLWTRFTAECDADGRTDFHGLQALVARAMVESGESLIRFRPRSTIDGLAVPLQLQVLEADHLDTLRSGETKGGGFIHQGIEFDPCLSGYHPHPLHVGCSQSPE